MQAARRLATTSLLRRQRIVPPNTDLTRRSFSFNFAGPKKLHDILKKELVEDKSKTEIADLWYQYHEGKVRLSLSS